MTDLLTTDHADSGEVVRLHPSIVDTHRLELGERTGNLAPYAHGLRPAFRRPDSTGEQPVYRPQTISVVDGEPAGLQEPPIVPPPTPLPPPPPTRNRHRRARPAWSPLARRALMGWVGTVVVELAGIAALVVLR